MCKGPLNKKFPDLFSQIGVPPEEAHEEKIQVFRALRTGTVDSESFLPTYVEIWGSYEDMPEEEKPIKANYSVSTYEKPRDVKRFASMNSDLGIPYKIATGFTAPECGVVLRDKEIKDAIKDQRKSSHVNWWLYENVTPYLHFELIPDFKEFYEETKKKEE